MPDVTPGQAQAADPVEMISAMLDAEKVTPEEKEAQPEKETSEPSNNAQVEGDDAPKDEGEPEKEAVAEIPLDQIEAIELEVEVSGDKGKVLEKLPIKELKLGYMRQKDYQTKTAEVARQRDEVGQKLRQGIEGERTQYIEQLQQMRNAIIDSVAPELKNADWNTLATNDPFEYVRLRNRHEQVQGTINGIEQKIREAKSKQEADHLATAKEQAAKTWSTLESDIPGWNQELYQSVVKAAESVGFSQAEAGSFLDARAVKLLHKAYLYDQLKAGKPPAEKKVVAAPKVITPGAAQSVSKQTQQRTSATERLRKTGRVEDLAALIATQI